MQEALSSKMQDDGSIADDPGRVSKGLSEVSSVRICCSGISFQTALLRVMYSSSVVLSAISVWSLLPQCIGQLL